jgi:hypothetical protein
MSSTKTSPGAQGTELKASAVIIDILTVIDTDRVIAYCEKNHITPSTKMDQPTGIDHSHEFMICTGAREIVSGQGTGDLHFRANPGDVIHFRGTSIYANSDDAVILYDIIKFKGDDVFYPNKFNVTKVKRNGAVMPDPNTPNGVPPLHAAMSFNSYSATVSESGDEWFKVRFGLYRLDDKGQTQNLYGYFEWDPRLTVLG